MYPSEESLSEHIFMKSGSSRFEQVESLIGGKSWDSKTFPEQLTLNSVAFSPLINK